MGVLIEKIDIGSTSKDVLQRLEELKEYGCSYWRFSMFPLEHFRKRKKIINYIKKKQERISDKTIVPEEIERILYSDTERLYQEIVSKPK